MSDAEQALLGWAAAVRDALDLPLPSITDSDRELFEVLLEKRRTIVKITADDVVRDHGEACSVRRATEWLRSRIGRLPVTYQPHEPDALEHPGTAVSREPL